MESSKLGSAIGKYQTAEYTMVISFNVISLLQGTIVFGATVLGLVLCVKVSADLASSKHGRDKRGSSGRFKQCMQIPSHLLPNSVRY